VAGRSEKALVLALVEMYIQGVSTRKVQKIVQELCGLLISASQVSALVKKLDGELEAWRRRSLAGRKYPYLVVDADHERVRREGRDDTHARKRLRSTNSVEHEHAEVRRRTRVVRIFPNEGSLIRLTTTLAIERNEQWSERRYLSMPARPRAEEEPVRQEA
jgi:transposase-like protein